MLKRSATDSTSNELVVRRRRLRRLGLQSVVAFFFIVTLPLWAAERIGGSILVVMSDASSVYNSVEESLRARLGTLCTGGPECPAPSLQTVTADQIENGRTIDRERDLVVAVGSRAARALRANPPAAPILFTLIPSGDLNHGPEQFLRPGDSAIYVDQPLERQLRLALQIRPVPSAVGVLLAPSGTRTAERLQNAANNLGLSVVVEVIEAEADIGPALKRLLDESDILLTVPDPSIYNRKTTFNILLSSYHNKVPVIGFSSAYVKAGALAGVYTSPADAGRHAAEAVAQYLTARGKELPAPGYPRYFSVAVNPQVARSLSIHLPDALELGKRLKDPQR